MNLRRAIEIALDKGELSGFWPFSQFPKDCCEHTCDILGYLLSEVNIQSVQINGIYCNRNIGPEWHHVWLLTETGMIIDITEDQFAGILLESKDVVVVRVGKEGPAQKLFSKDRIKQPNTIFSDQNEYTDFGGRPNPRQKRLLEVYNTIKRYL